MHRTPSHPPILATNAATNDDFGGDVVADPSGDRAGRRPAESRGSPRRRVFLSRYSRSGSIELKSHKVAALSRAFALTLSGEAAPGGHETQAGASQ
jgi:hypothetical protein